MGAIGSVSADSHKALVIEAAAALTSMKVVAADLDLLLQSLPKRTSRRVRDDVASAKRRLDKAIDQLADELDSPAVDSVSLSLRARLAHRALALLGAAALVGAVAEGGAAAIEIAQTVRDDAHQAEMELDDLISTCELVILQSEGSEVESTDGSEVEGTESTGSDRGESQLDPTPPPSSDSPSAEEALSYLGRSLLLAEIEKLPKNQRITMQLLFEHGRSLREVAELMDRPMQEVRAEAQAARSTLRAALEAEG